MKTKIYTNCLEVKSASCEGEFTGYASIYNIVDKFGDVILPGAFRDTLANTKQILLLWQHDHKEPIGYFAEIRETVHGLFVKGKLLTELIRAREAYTLIKSGVIDGLSIGFEIDDAFFAGDVRYIKRVTLWEISLVTFPANRDARVQDVKCKTPQMLAAYAALKRTIRILQNA